MPQTPWRRGIQASSGREVERVGATDLDKTGAGELEQTQQHSSLSQGWGRLLRSNRVIWVIAGVAVISLIAGLLLGRLVVSPSQAALDSKAPDSGLIPAAVELRQLSNEVTLRADVGYADSIDVSLAVNKDAVITGQVPKVGATFSALNVALEVGGRPVIVLPGDLPSFRDLTIGSSGPDVVQFKQALSAVGIDPGDSSSNVFDADTSEAIKQLYEKVGYPIPGSSVDRAATAESLRAAREAVRVAERGVEKAQQALNAAGGVAATKVKEQNNLVAAQERSLASAKEALARAETASPQDPAALSQARNDVASYQDALDLAYLQRDAALKTFDASVEQDELAAARGSLDAARAGLSSAQDESMNHLPVGEVLFLPGLPRRVDEVKVSRGDKLSGVAMSVSGADIQLLGAVAEADAKLLKVGEQASFEGPGGEKFTAKVSSVKAPSGSDTGSSNPENPENPEEAEGPVSTRWDVILIPEGLTPEQIEKLRGGNVKVSIPVSATEGEVLVVPLAAVTAGSGGDFRVEVVADSKDSEAETRLVVVETGLSAEGYVEVKPKEGSLGEGDLVVVGR